MKEKPGLYLHVPFCKSKCPYCDFFSVTSDIRAQEMVQAMLVELDHRAGPMEPFDTVYVGGGTPSSIKPSLLRTLIRGTLDHASPEPTPEITVEINPADVNHALLETLQETGVNRISLGIQSFSDNNLSTLGRRHDSKQAFEAIELIKKKGFETLGIDLIYGLPGCPHRVWREDLERALSVKPQHLSCYALTISPTTPFGRDRSLGLRKFPGDNTLADLFMETSEILTSSGYIHYEVSNFATDLDSRSRHNRKYWQRVEYTGIGPSAHSFASTQRCWNICNVDSYCEQVSKTKTAFMGKELITPKQAYMETVALGIRTSEGVELTILREHGITDEKLQKLGAMGLIETDNQRVRPTIKGFLLADSLAAELT